MGIKRVVLSGIPVLVVGEAPGKPGCDKCVFLSKCPPPIAERKAGLLTCTAGGHYYIHAPETTEDRAEHLALEYHAQMSNLSLTEHSHVLRILQSELGKRRTAALFKPK